MTRPDWEGFVREVFGDGTRGEWEGGKIQDVAEKHGVLVRTRFTEPCGESCACAESGDFPTDCFRLAAASTTADEAAEATKRLDWLERTRRLNYAGKGNPPTLVSRTWSITAPVNLDNIRAAIDAARKGGGAE